MPYSRIYLLKRVLLIAYLYSRERDGIRIQRSNKLPVDRVGIRQFMKYWVTLPNTSKG